MQSSEIKIVAIVYALENQEQKVKEVLMKCVEPTRKEPGNIEYDLHQDSEDPKRFAFTEKWKNEEEFSAHLQTDHLKQLLKNTEGITDKTKSEFYKLAKI